MLSENKVKSVVKKLYEMYPDAKCELNHSNPFELLIATVLSAQTTDKKVNEVTKELFKEYNTPIKILTLNEEQLQSKIRVIGLYKNKSKNILLLCKTLIDNFQGEVPKTMDELITLPGVGRKTANVVLSNSFGVSAFAVDTHVFRVSNRIGLSDGKDVLKVETQLMERIPKARWIIAHHTLIFHGRRTCKAIKPQCENCGVSKWCEFYKTRNLDNDIQNS